MSFSQEFVPLAVQSNRLGRVLIRGFTHFDRYGWLPFEGLRKTNVSSGTYSNEEVVFLSSELELRLSRIFLYLFHNRKPTADPRVPRPAMIPTSSSKEADAPVVVTVVDSPLALQWFDEYPGSTLNV